MWTSGLLLLLPLLPPNAPARDGPQTILTGALAVSGDADVDGIPDLLAAAARREVVGSRWRRRIVDTGEVHQYSGRTGALLGTWRAPAGSGQVSALACLPGSVGEPRAVVGLPAAGEGGRVEVRSIPSGELHGRWDAPEGTDGFGARLEVLEGEPARILAYTATGAGVLLDAASSEPVWARGSVLDVEAVEDVDEDGVLDLVALREAEAGGGVLLEVLSGSNGATLQSFEVPFPVEAHGARVEVLGEVAWVFAREPIADEYALRCMALAWEAGERRGGFTLFEWGTIWEGFCTTTLDRTHVAIGDPEGWAGWSPAGRLVVVNLDEGREVCTLTAPHVDGLYLDSYGTAVGALGDVDGDGMPDLAVSSADSLLGGAVQAASGRCHEFWFRRP